MCVLLWWETVGPAKKEWKMREDDIDTFCVVGFPITLKRMEKKKKKKKAKKEKSQNGSV